MGNIMKSNSYQCQECCRDICFVAGLKGKRYRRTASPGHWAQLSKPSGGWGERFELAERTSEEEIQCKNCIISGITVE